MTRVVTRCRFRPLPRRNHARCLAAGRIPAPPRLRSSSHTREFCARTALNPCRARAGFEHALCRQDFADIAHLARTNCTRLEESYEAKTPQKTSSSG